MFIIDRKVFGEPVDIVFERFNNTVSGVVPEENHSFEQSSLSERIEPEIQESENKFNQL